MAHANESGLGLKWKTSRQKAWRTKVQEVPMEQLVVGEAFRLCVFTNDFSSGYDLWAMLRASDRLLQGGKFEQLGSIFSIYLNPFYDTIRHSGGEDTTLTVEIIESSSNQLIAEVDILRFLGRVDVSLYKETRAQASRHG